MPNDYQNILQFARANVKSAGELIAHYRREGFEINHKGDFNLVTSADLEADKLIVSAIKSEFPGHAILSEESSPDLLSSHDPKQPLWIIDPIDGTSNYAHGHPHVGISVAYYEAGEVKVGVVGAPFYSETYWAIKGQGAYLNDRKIQIKELTELKSALVCTGFPYDRSNLPEVVRKVKQVLSSCRDLRRLGAASVDIAWVACGRLDAFYEVLAPWDFAAAALIAREAGALTGLVKATSQSGIPIDLQGDELLVSPPGLFTKLQKLLNE